ncbi:13713_t:CDS:2, partial [Dentiscutata heterogama]
SVGTYPNTNLKGSVQRQISEELKRVNNTPSLVADIKTYDDGSILVHIIRNDSAQLTDNCLKIRGIKIDPNLNLHPVNYCLLNSDNTEYKINRLNNIVTYLKDNNTSILRNIINPTSIYPLQKPFILVTYVKTTNSSNLTTYEEWADVIDWDGNSRSTTFLGVWINSTIQLNINKKLGFLRFASDQTYWSDDSGNLTQMKKTDDITYYRYSDSPITIISTVDNGYIVVAVFNNILESNN